MKIKKLVSASAFAALALFAIGAQAGNIDSNAARETAKRFINQHASTSRTFKSVANADIRLTHTERSSVSGNAYYVFNLDGGGWVIVAGDDHARQVLAYGNKGNIDMNDMPANMKGQLDLYKRQIEAMQNYKGKLVQKKATNRNIVVEPLLKTTWGQQAPMNQLDPTNSSGETTSVGCGPLAMAQIVNYWKYPTEIAALPGYSISWSQSVPSLPATTIDYSLLLDAYTIFNPETNGVSLGTFTEEQGNEVAKLCRYCGQACEARYGNSGGTGTGTYTYDQLDAFKTFGYNSEAKLIGYDPSYYCYNSTKYTEEEWVDLIINELTQKHPIAYHNSDFDMGHAWVLDGIDADNKLHMNWGFYERFDGWFEFGAFGFYPYGNDEYWDFSCSNSTGNEMIIDLFPYEGYVIPGDDPEPEVMKGDVNNDGKVNISDVTVLINYLLSQDTTGVNVDAADCNEDQKVNISDVTVLINFLLSGAW